MPRNESKRDDLGELWIEYARTRDVELRDKLTLAYADLVKTLVRRMMPRYGAVAEFDDLVSCGILGLIDAVERFDLAHGVKFETYAVRRIRGEILDYLRSQDWAPTSLRRRISAVTDAFDELEAAGDSEHAEYKIASKLGMTEEQVDRLLARSHMFNIMRFEEALEGDQAHREPRVAEEDLPENVLLKHDLSDRLTAAIESLPERERLVVTLYYYEGLMLHDIADALGVTESRVSQMHSKIIVKLRATLERD
jgi:RNA polymerase sigma factor for flagellar operon FliA